MSNEAPRHPAKFTKSIVAKAAEILARYGVPDTLDPFAGTGERIAALHEHGWRGDIYANELQPKWARQAPSIVHMTIGDAETLPYADGRFSSIFTSVTYGNRMADKHKARDDSRRNTYTHAYGEPLADGNTGTMQFGETRRTRLEYCRKHKRCYVEFLRVLADGGILVFNAKDHIRRGKRQRVVLWHVLVLKRLGFEVLEWHRVKTPGQRQGANGEKRVEYEMVVVLRKGALK